jgi:hypothetical protein
MVGAEEESVDVRALLCDPPGKFFVLRRNVKFGKTPPCHRWLIRDHHDEPASFIERADGSPGFGVGFENPTAGVGCNDSVTV